MIFLLDTSDDHGEAATELGVPCGQLITPLTGRSDRGDTYAIDNGAFAGFDAARFKAILNRQKPHRDRCLFVAAPDVVGSARRTLEVFGHWESDLAGWKIALVLQDGIEDLSIPWDRISAVFVGGSTEFKNSDAAMQCAKAARILGKWVHVGRVNTAIRFDRWANDADSMDGTGVSRYSHMRTDARAGLPLLGGAA